MSKPMSRNSKKNSLGGGHHKTPTKLPFHGFGEKIAGTLLKCHSELQSGKESAIRKFNCKRATIPDRDVQVSLESDPTSQKRGMK